jgi:hypothetical protein
MVHKGDCQAATPQDGSGRDSTETPTDKKASEIPARRPPHGARHEPIRAFTHGWTDF